jgi:outer membrane protein assembly factor BamB
VTATTTGGGRVWSVDLRPAGESERSVSGGGVAYEGNRVFVTTGYGELVAMDPRGGAVAWRQKVDAPVSGAPTVQDGVVYLVGRDAPWRVSGTDGMAGVMGVAAPAIQGGTVVFPFSNGGLMGVEAKSGNQLWTANVGGSRLGRSIALFRDMTGDPVIAGDTIYAGTSSGKVGAYDLTTGMQKWEAPEGASSPALVAGNSVFLVNDQAQLIRLDAATKQIVRKQDKVWNHYGPVLAGSKLYLAGSDGYLRVFDPASGALIGTAEIPGGAAAAPAVAGQTLYVVTHGGQLIAYR